jgi:hypothetical protein
MHEYKRKDIQECFHQRRLVFVGDSTVRQIYWAVTKKMDLERAQEEFSIMLDHDEKHKDLEFTSGGVSVEFIWDPWLNSSGLEHELRKFRANPSLDVDGGLDNSAGLLLVGAPGLWYARHGQENYAKNFRDAIDKVIPFMDHEPETESKKHASAPLPTGKLTPNLLLLAPIQVPRYQSLSPSREATITPDKIDQMNDYLQQVSANSNADIVWSYSLMTWNTRGVYEESGLHVVDNVAHRKADVLLNLRCNADAVNTGYPFDRTCCQNYKHPGGIQWVMIFTGMLLLPGAYFLRRVQHSRTARLLPNTEVLTATTIFCLVVCFCFYADRTQIFEKSHRQFWTREFLAACVLAGAAGLLSVRRSASSHLSEKASTTADDDGFLSRDQTDEWKGWMQFFILIYHYTHASKTMWIYYVVRLLVASYLFMTGYGHTLYFLRKDDYSLKRVAAVLIRLNMLSCALPYMMRTDYLFYYFAPLVSFWFCVLYATLRIKHSQNSNAGFLLAKIVLSGMITTAFVKIPGVAEFFAMVLKYTCAISWNVPEWRFRTFLDMYIVYIGMIVAMLYNRVSKLNSGVDPTSSFDRLLKFTITYQLVSKIFLVILALILLPGFWAVSQTHTKKSDFNWWHTYISFLPILSFVALRNSNRYFRNYHSRVFGWLGRCSLETYILQFHIWLAGDTKGLLKLGLWNRQVEAAVLTVIFLWISWTTSKVTHTLTKWIVGGQGNESWANFIGLNVGDSNMRRSPYLSPLMTQEEAPATPSKDIRFDIGGPKWLQRLILGFREDLRWKVGLILILLWLGNICYN